MNDFTKDELDILENIMCGAGNLRGIDSKSYVFKDLLKKIQSLIDNYCEHELEPFTSFKDMCTKCKGIF